jgi:hypothetical protein
VTPLDGAHAGKSGVIASVGLVAAALLVGTGLV